MTGYTTFVLDRSGSMESIKPKTIDGFNEFIRSQKTNNADSVFTMVLFDSTAIETRYSAVHIKDVDELTSDTYKLGECTPLYDAACQAIRETAQKAPPGAPITIVIQTDGWENASKENTQDTLHALITEKRALGWHFIFLGANIDAFAVARQMGIDAAQTLNYSGPTSDVAFQAASRSTLAYNNEAKTSGTIAASRSASNRFTDEERHAARTPTKGSTR